MNRMMDEHEREWIAAYYDGELSGERLRRMEAHLAACPECRAELEALRALSAMLAESPAPQPRATPEQFVSQVMLRLPRTAPAASPAPLNGWTQPLTLAWKLAPLVMFAAWAFLQASVLLTGILGWILQSSGLGIGVLHSLPLASSLLDLSTFSLFNLLSAPGSLAGAAGPLVDILLLEALLTLITTALLWGWLASWWAVRRPARRLENKSLTGY